MKKSIMVILLVLSSIFAFGQSFYKQTVVARKEIESKNFRGMRTADYNGLFILTSTSAKLSENGLVAVVLEFSNPVDPNSFNLDSVVINDLPLAQETQLSFNRNGTKCCLYLEREQLPVKIDLTDVYSFNGKRLHPLSTYVKLES